MTSGAAQSQHRRDQGSEKQSEMLGALRTRSRTSASIRPPQQKLDAGRLRTRRKTTAPTPLIGCPSRKRSATLQASSSTRAAIARARGDRASLPRWPRSNQLATNTARPGSIPAASPIRPTIGGRPQRATQASPLHDAGNGDITAAMALRVDRHVTAARLWSEATAGMSVNGETPASPPPAPCATNAIRRFDYGPRLFDPRLR